MAAVTSAVDAPALSLEELYDRYGSAAYGLALRILRDARHAEDAVQEAFLDLWRRDDRFDATRGTLRTWLLMHVHRRAVDIVRREHRHRAAPLDGAPEPEAADTSEEVWLRAERTRVQEALEQLPERQRQLLELAYYGGLTQPDLAERLGVPLGTVKSGTHAALSRLRFLLAQS